MVTTELVYKIPIIAKRTVDSQKMGSEPIHIVYVYARHEYASNTAAVSGLKRKKKQMPFQ